MDKFTKKKMVKKVSPSGDPRWSDARTDIVIPAFPSNLTRCGYRELGELHSEYMAHCAFINEEVARLKFQEKLAKLKLKRLLAQKLFAATGSFKAKQFAKVNVDIEVQNMRQEVLMTQARTSVVYSLLWTVKGYVGAIKFEVERRRSGVQEDIGE